VIYTRAHGRCVSAHDKAFIPTSSPFAYPDTHTDGLSIAGNAPAIFGRTLRNGLPVTALIASSAFSLLAFMGVSAGAGKVFNWFANMTSIAGLLTWFGISFTYIRFYAGMKAQGIDRQTLPFSSRLQPYAAWYSAVFCIIICVVRYHTLSFFFFFFLLTSRNFETYSSTGGPSSSTANGTQPPLSQAISPSCFSRYCTSARGTGNVLPLSHHHRWISTRDLRR
jgi:Amino acid permease